MAGNLAPQNPLSYMGVKPPRPPNVIQENHAPTTLDTNYDIGTEWVNTTAPQVYFLADVNGAVASWLPLGGGTSDVQSLTGNSGGVVFPTGGNIDIVGDNTQGIDIVGSPGTSTLTVSGIDATESQIGVVEFATAAETITGTSTALAVHPSGLDAKLGTQTSNGLIYGQGGAGSALGALAEATNGQLPIGNTGNPPTLALPISTDGSVTITAGAGTLDFEVTGGGAMTQIGVDASTPPGTDPVVPDGGGVITITGNQVAATTTANVIQTNSLAVNSFEIQIQRSEAVASSTVGSNGVSHFDSDFFTVDSDGFVSLTSTSPLTWIDEGTGITLALNTGYFVTAAVTETLPAAPAQGDTVKIICDHAGPVVITANTGQTISLGNTSSSTAGTFTNTAIGDALELFYRDSTSEWKALNAVGNWTIA